MLQYSNFHDVQEVKHVTKEKESGLLCPESRNLNADSTQASRAAKVGFLPKLLPWSPDASVGLQWEDLHFLLWKASWADKVQKMVPEESSLENEIEKYKLTSTVK